MWVQVVVGEGGEVRSRRGLMEMVLARGVGEELLARKEREVEKEDVVEKENEI